jgi:YebC/PmpR family DNA-binding regulatory protein
MGRMFEVRKAAMFARWAKNSKAFSKLGKEIAIAVKLGGNDPDNNPRLRNAIKTARSLNMPKDNIQSSINRASSKDASDLQELTYEGYGPHGVAIFIETTTDNPTRTVANIRSSFSKNGGSLAQSGAVDFMFTRRGVFTIEKPSGDLEEFELEMIDHGLEDMFETEDGYLLYSTFTDFGTLQKALEAKNIAVKNAALQRFSTTTVEVTNEQRADLDKLISVLEEDDDVQFVYSTLKQVEE